MNTTLEITDRDGKPRTLPAQAVIDAASDELYRRWNETGKRTVLKSSEDSEKALRVLLADDTHETFAVLFLNCRNKVLAFEKLFHGTLDSAMVYPREIVRKAIEHNASAVILAHNHPSGVAEPSHADHAITERIRKACGLIDVRVLDHFVITPADCTSLARLGAL